MRLPADIRITVRSEPRLLRGLRGLVRCYVVDAGFSEQCAEEVVLALDEACTNAIQHSYAGQTQKTFSIEMRAEREELVFRLRDSGRPALPERIAPKAPRPPKLSRLKPGGLGLQFIHQVFDEVIFTPGVESGNRIEMRLRRK